MRRPSQQSALYLCPLLLDDISRKYSRPLSFLASSFQINVVVCFYGYVCVRNGAWTHTDTYVQSISGYLPQSFSISSFELGPLAKPVAYQFGYYLASGISYFHLPSAGTADAHISLYIAFYMCSGNKAQLSMFMQQVLYWQMHLPNSSKRYILLLFLLWCLQIMLIIEHEALD